MKVSGLPCSLRRFSKATGESLSPGQPSEQLCISQDGFPGDRIKCGLCANVTVDLEHSSGSLWPNLTFLKPPSPV